MAPQNPVNNADGGEDRKARWVKRDAIQKRNRDEIQRVIAYHEAGHAVVARTLGVQINDIRLASRDNHVQTYSAGWAAKDDTVEDRIAGYEKDAKVAMAGMIAQPKLNVSFARQLTVPRMGSSVIPLPAVDLPGDQNSFCKKICRPVRASV
jgi:hypothetical protein